MSRYGDRLLIQRSSGRTPEVSGAIFARYLKIQCESSGSVITEAYGQDPHRHGTPRADQRVDLVHLGDQSRPGRAAFLAGNSSRLLAARFIALRVLIRLSAVASCTPWEPAASHGARPERVNVDFTVEMLKELDDFAGELNISRQAVIKSFLRQALDQHYIAKSKVG